MGKVYGYTRVSHIDSANSGLSIEAQRQTITHWFKVLESQDSTLEWGEMIKDLAQSAFNKNLIARPGGMRMNSMLQAGDHVVFAKLDRGFRNTMDCLRTIKLWQDRGIIIHFIDLHLNTGTSMGKMMLTILSALAEWESARKSERIREALAIKKLNRDKSNNHAKKGFRFVPRTRGKHAKDVPDLRVRALCLLSWVLRKHGMTCREIGNHIEALLARREGRRFIHFARDSEREWTNSCVSSGILAGEEYRRARARDPGAEWPPWNRRKKGSTKVR